jgi:hypothetical protein
MGHDVVLAVMMVAAILLPPVLPAAEPPAGAAAKLWTVMVYMSADNNLEPDGIHDFNEMESVGSTTT